MSSHHIFTSLPHIPTSHSPSSNYLFAANNSRTCGSRMQETRVKGGSTRAEHFRQLLIRQTGLSSPRQDSFHSLQPTSASQIRKQHRASTSRCQRHQQITMPLQSVNVAKIDSSTSSFDNRKIFISLRRYLLST